MPESDSRLLPGTSQRVALPELPTGVKGVHRTSVRQGRRSDFPARWSIEPHREAESDGRAQTGGVTLKMSQAFTGRCLSARLAFTSLHSLSADRRSWTNNWEALSG